MLFTSFHPEISIPIQSHWVSLDKAGGTSNRFELLNQPTIWQFLSRYLKYPMSCWTASLQLEMQHFLWRGTLNWNGMSCVAATQHLEIKLSSHWNFLCKGTLSSGTYLAKLGNEMLVSHQWAFGIAALNFCWSSSMPLFFIRSWTSAQSWMLHFFWSHSVWCWWFWWLENGVSAEQLTLTRRRWRSLLCINTNQYLC